LHQVSTFGPEMAKTFETKKTMLSVTPLQPPMIEAAAAMMTTTAAEERQQLQQQTVAA